MPPLENTTYFFMILKKGAVPLCINTSQASRLRQLCTTIKNPSIHSFQWQLHYYVKEKKKKNNPPVLRGDQCGQPAAGQLTTARHFRYIFLDLL